MTNGWHEGTVGNLIGSDDKRIAHYWVKTADEDLEEGMGRIIKLQIKISGETVVNYDRGWDIEPDESDRLVMIAYSICMQEYK
jgi:hypothetical protein